MYIHMQQEGKRECRRLKIGETSGKVEWWMGPGSLTSERETKEARRTAGGTTFLLTVSLFWWTQGLCMRESKTRKTALRILPHPLDLSPGSELASQTVCRSRALGGPCTTLAHPGFRAARHSQPQPKPFSPLEPALSPLVSVKLITIILVL